MPAEPTAAEMRESLRIAADADIVHAVSINTTTYAVQEYHPYDQCWVVAWGDIDTADEAISKRDALAAKCAEAGDSESRFRVTEVVSVTTTRVLD